MTPSKQVNIQLKTTIKKPSLPEIFFAGGTYIIGNMPKINATMVAYIKGKIAESLFSKEIQKEINKKRELNKKINPIYRMII